MTPVAFTPAFFIPVWFNILLLLGGILLGGTALYLSISQCVKWFVSLPLGFYAGHFVIFYSVIVFAQLTGHLLDNEVMTLWSAILRFHGMFTAIVTIYIIYLTYGRFKDE